MVLSVISMFAVVAVAFTSIQRNADVFSPAKIGLVYLTLYFLKVFSFDADFRLQLMYLGLLGTMYGVACNEPKIKSSAWRFVSTAKSDLLESHFVGLALFSIFLISFGAVAHKLYDAWAFGGLRDLWMATKMRVIGIEGLEKSYLRFVLFELLPYTNLALYILLFITNRLDFRWKAVYFAHLAVVVGMGVLSLSRGASFIPIVSFLVLRNYCERQVTFRLAATVVSALIAVSVIMGNVRNQFYFERSGTINLGLDRGTNPDLLDNPIFIYGTSGLQAFLETGVHTPSYGSTFLSILTQPIPRAVFPEKLDTGGVFFTRRYLNDAWGGSSNATTGFLGESVMAFGWVFGLVFGYCVYAVFWKYVIRIYRTAWKYRPLDSAMYSILILCYLRSVQLCGALLVGEFTNVMYKDLYLLLPVVLICWRILARNFRRKRIGRPEIAGDAQSALLG